VHFYLGIWHQVRLCDQENINEFGRLNNKLLELQADMKQFTMDVEKLEDAASELMMVTDDKCMLFIGESFIECSEEYATEYCENKVEVTASMT
jgi:prefoldin subunit 4